MGAFLRENSAPDVAPAVAQPYNVVRPLTAAASRVKINDKAEAERLQKRKKAAAWQNEAYAYFDCVDTDTQILTVDGWRSYDQIAVGDLVRTLDHDTGTAGWEPIQEVVTYDVENIDMFSMEMRHHSSLTTMHHRWPVLGQVYTNMRRSGFDRRWVTSETMPSEASLITAAPSRDIPIESKWSDDFVALVAWFWTEGTILRNKKSGRRTGITISQSARVNPQWTAEIELLLTRAFPGQWIIWDRSDGQRYFNLHVGVTDALLEVAPNKIVSLDFIRDLTLSQLSLFCDVSMRADGHQTAGPSRLMTQSVAERLDAYEYACILRGTTPHTVAQPQHGRTCLLELPRATARPRKKCRQVVKYTGVVWCVRTKSQSWMARRNGTVFYTGNTIGEIKYAFLLTGAVISRVKLYVGYVNSPSDNPGRLEDVPDLPDNYLDVASAHFQRLESGYGGIPGLLRDASINLSISGECFLLQEKAKLASGIPEKWTIRSVDEIEIDTSGNMGLRTSSSTKGAEGLEMISPETFIGRLWRPHPRFHEDSDSSMRALLELCAELLLLNRTVQATAKSRLNAGALFIPDGLSVAAQPDVTEEDGDFETAEDDAFEQELLAAMTLPIQDPDSASAVVPLLIRGPGELGNQIKQFSFQRSFDAALVERADRVLERIMQGLDIPKDIVTGLANVRYSNAIQIQESLYRAHIEPLTLIICDALTMIFMRPAMRVMGFPEDIVNNTVIWYDPTDILTSADRASNADVGFDKYLLSGDTWRTTHGFADTDAPTGEELLNRIIVSRGQITAELTEAVLARLAPDSFKEAREAALEGKGTVFPENLENLLETGQLPEEAAGQEPLPPEILEGLPIPSPAVSGAQEAGILTEEEQAAQDEAAAPPEGEEVPAEEEVPAPA